MPPSLRKLFREQVRREARSLDRWVDVFPATMGNAADGTILTGTSGIVWVQHVVNGQAYEVHNTIAPTDRLGLHVVVGRYAGETIWRIKDVSTSYGLTASVGNVTQTAVQDQFIDRDHFLPFLVAPVDGGGFVVNVFGDTFIRADGTTGAIANQTFDLTSHVPAAGALYVLLEADDDGVLYATDGDVVDTKELLTLADIPPITPGRRASCAVRLYSTQVQLYRDRASVNDFVDLRALTSGGGGGDIVYVRKFVDQLVAPTVDDDIDAGYLATDLWHYDSDYGPEIYLCQDNTVGAADWLLLGSAGSGAWGAITGTLSDQTDLQAELDGKVSHSLATAVNDFLVASGAGAWGKKTLAEVVTILRTSLDSIYVLVSALFNDAEGNPAPIGTAADGTSAYAARRDHIHAVTNGSAVLGSSFNITAALDTYEDTGLSVTLPSAGTYKLSVDVRAVLNGNVGTSWLIAVQLYNSTDSAAVANSDRQIINTNSGSVAIRGTASINAIITVAASKTIKLYAKRNGTGSATFNQSTIPSDSNGYTVLMYEKIG